MKPTENVVLIYKGKTIEISHQDFEALMDCARSWANQGMEFREEEGYSSTFERWTYLRKLANTIAYAIDC